MPAVVLNILMAAFLVLCWIAIVMLARTTFWSEQARAVLMWRSPFMRGSALRNWAATIVEQFALNRLTGQRTGLKAVQLAAEVEEGAMRAMMPLAQQAEFERIVACPETGQGLLGATALEALAIAAQPLARRTEANSRSGYREFEQDGTPNWRREEFAPAPVPATRPGPGLLCLCRATVALSSAACQVHC